MLLKSIELYGFKSFADRSVVEFTDGICAVLGPNGCGKSNIVDAIKWVLGEQGTRSLRAENMEDVIFNGTDNRKAVSVAEITLILQNDDGVLPLDVPEISVRRRLYRSGESEYLINNSSVKLKELRELFYDTGIGKSSYSIMEQGKIDQILSNKPEERRAVFEEAAMITRYKVRGKEAERKLERTEDNMRQVEGILGEVRRSYDSLKKQAEKTTRYRELRSRMFEIERDIALIRLRSCLEDRDKRTAQLETRTAERDAVRGRIDAINESLENNLDLVNTMESRLMDGQKRLYGLELEKNNRDNQIRMLAERISDIQQKSARDVARKAALEERLETLTREIERKEDQQREFTQQISELDGNIASFKQSIDQAAERIGSNAASIKHSNAEIDGCEREDEAVQEELRVVTDDIVEELDRKLRESGYSSRDRDELEDAISTALSRLSLQLEGKSALIHDAAALQDSDRERTQQVFDTTAATLETALSEVRRVIELFARYRDVTPAFLDEFLAPEGIITRKRRMDERVQQLRRTIRQAREEIARRTDENQSLQSRIDDYRRTLEELRVNLARMRAQLSALQNDIQRSSQERANTGTAIEEVEAHLAEEKRRVEETRIRIAELTVKRSQLEENEQTLKRELNELEEGINSINADLIRTERALKAMMEDLGKTQTQVERLQVAAAETNAEIRNIYDNFRERHSQELSEHESRAFELGGTSVKHLRDRLAQVREQERTLGSVNLMAPEEFAEVKERYDFLFGQLDDLKRAKADLIRVTAEIRHESAELFTQTYERIRKNFHTMFRRLFGGGRAELKLIEPEDVLESGIDILVQPPGKKLENIALLSGGERALTAVALLFATYMVKPSPFCLLDEIDAALDESNVGRFVNMLFEFAQSSQFIIITHNKKTIAAATTLIGITMEEPGVSKVVSVRVDNREKEPVGATS
ncbi:MAG: chromosome segregation protein SMC [Spirochaetaceae bacterium]|nr:MAG: chromosome segregation protein SMC [Spirochaetaceae bacterium]